jgi:hypothetical protein
MNSVTEPRCTSTQSIQVLKLWLHGGYLVDARAALLDQQRRLVMVDLARALFKARRADEAVSMCPMTAQPSQSDAYLLLGRILGELESGEEAESAYRRDLDVATARGAR